MIDRRERATEIVGKFFEATEGADAVSLIDALTMFLGIAVSTIAEETGDSSEESVHAGIDAVAADAKTFQRLYADHFGVGR